MSAVMPGLQVENVGGGGARSPVGVATSAGKRRRKGKLAPGGKNAPGLGLVISATCWSTVTSCWFATALVARPELDAVQRLRGVVEVIVRRRATQPARFRLLIRSEAELPDELTAAYDASRRAVLRTIAGIVEDGVRAGVFRGDAVHRGRGLGNFHPRIREQLLRLRGAAVDAHQRGRDDPAFMRVRPRRLQVEGEHFARVEGGHDPTLNGCPDHGPAGLNCRRLDSSA